MDLGKNIKEYRIKNGLSQKDLADRLFVTYQAVSRWENNQAEPSIDTLNSMASIFGCTINDIVSGEAGKEVLPMDETPPDVSEFDDESKPAPVVKENQPVVETPKPQPVVSTPPVVEKPPVVKTNPPAPRQIIAFCDVCDKPIYELSNLKRLKLASGTYTGVPGSQVEKKFNYCLKCYNKYLQDQKERKKREEEQKLYNIKHSRNLSLGLSTLFSAIFLLIGVLLFTLTEYQNIGIFFMVSAVPTFTFVGTMVLDNTFLNEFWFGAMELGFVKMPGIIFTFDLGGFIFLIVMKILFAILGFLIGVVVFILATGIAYFLSLFAYPLAMVRNHNEAPELNSANKMQSIKQYVESKEK